RARRLHGAEAGQLRLGRHHDAVADRRVAADLPHRYRADLRLRRRAAMAAFVRPRRGDGARLVANGPPDRVRPPLADPAGDHAVAVPAHAHHAPRARRDARGAAAGLHPLRPRARAVEAGDQFRPCAEEHDGARHHHHRPPARLGHRLLDRHRDRVPVAGRRLAVHQLRAGRRRAGDGRLPDVHRLHLRRHQPDRRHPLLRRRSAPSGARHRRGEMTMSTAPTTQTAVAPPRSFARRVWDSDVFFSFRRSPVTIVAALMTLVLVMSALLAPWIAPYDPFNPASLNLMDGFTPPMSTSMTGNYFLLGSDHQGRDVLSTILYGSRVSLFVGGS